MQVCISLYVSSSVSVCLCLCACPCFCYCFCLCLCLCLASVTVRSSVSLSSLCLSRCLCLCLCCCLCRCLCLGVCVCACLLADQVVGAYVTWPMSFANCHSAYVLACALSLTLFFFPTSLPSPAHLPTVFCLPFYHLLPPLCLSSRPCRSFTRVAGPATVAFSFGGTVQPQRWAAGDGAQTKQPAGRCVSKKRQGV